MLFSLMGAAIDSFLLYLLLHNQLEFKKKFKNPRLIGYLSFFILIARFLINWNVKESVMDYVSKILSIFLIFILILFLYSNSIKKKVISFLIFYTIIILSEVIIVCALLLLSYGMPFQQVMQNTAIAQICTIFSKIFAFGIINEFNLRSKNLDMPYHKELSFIMFCNVTLFFMILFLFRSDFTYMQNNSNPLIVLSFGLLFISIVATMLIIKISQRSKQEMDYQLRVQQLEMQTNMNQDMARLVYKLRSFRHDMNNHFSLMVGLLKENEYEQLEHYLSGIIEETSDVNNYIFLENKALTVVINNKLAKAAMHNVEFKPIIEVQTLPMNDLDICTLLSNILDNAIEAASQVADNAYLTLKLSKKGSYYFIQCVNSFKTMPIEKNGRFQTTKDNQNIHGLGIENIKNIVNEYDGELNIYYDDQFHIQVYLPDTSPQKEEL
ncbi:MAG: GHKL domain-containing protein [bacterium]|nr:GHKL domain-containing protein [bacterium]